MQAGMMFWQVRNRPVESGANVSRRSVVLECVLIRKQPTWFLVSVASIVIGLDQFAKYLVVQNLNLYQTWMPLEWLRPFFNITYTRNTGAAFGIFPAGSLAFMIIGPIVTLAIIYYFHQLPVEPWKGQWLARAALSLQLGGAIGNLIDRFRLGYVVDFLHVARFPVFNVADSSIVIGVIALIGLMIIEERREARQAKEDTLLEGKEGGQVEADSTLVSVVDAEPSISNDGAVPEI